MIIGDGIADDSAALIAAFAASDTVTLDGLTVRLSNPVTIPNGTTLILLHGSSLVPDSGVICTIQGEISAHHRKHIFKGAGSVVGLRVVHPAWFGAQGNAESASPTDDAPALQRAIDCMASSKDSDGDEQALVLAALKYLIKSTLTVRLNPYFSPRIRGAGPLFGSRLYTAASGFVGSVALQIDGSVPNSFDEIADFELSGFFVYGLPGTSCATGIKIGRGTRRLQGLHNSLIENVRSEGFAQCWTFTNCRNVTVRRCSGKGLDATLSRALYITLENDALASKFTGDMIFDGCQWEQGTTHNQRCVSIRNDVSGGGIAGLKFINNTTYGGQDGGIAIETSSGSNISDIWITDCQMDAGSYPVRAEAYDAGSYIHDVHITNMYAQGVASDVVRVIGGAGTMVKDIHVNGGRINGVVGRAVYVDGARSVLVNGLLMNAIQATGAIVLNNTAECVIIGNILNRAAAQAGGPEPILTTNMVILTGYAYFDSITGNSGGYACSGAVVSNGATGTNNLITNNV